MSKDYKVTIYPVTPWQITVAASSEEEAKEIALELEGPEMYAYQDVDEWSHDISEWPNIGKNGQIDVEEILN